MYEEDLKRIVSLHPELIENGLIITNEEYNIRSRGSTYRCDLKGLDSTKKAVFLELKLRANKSVVYQIAKYKALAAEQGRFMVGALEFDPETKDVLTNLGFETVVIDPAKVAQLLGRAMSNPALFVRKDSLTGTTRIKIPSDKAAYTEQESEIVMSFMQGMEQTLRKHPDMLPGYSVDRIDVRSPDKYRLLLAVNNAPADRLLVYLRARKSSEIDFMYVPDFSFEAKASTMRKKSFEEYILSNSYKVENLFDSQLFTGRQAGRAEGDRLEITSQAWKGFTQVYCRDFEAWKHPDFLEFMARKFFDFAGKLSELLDEWGPRQ